MNDFARVAGELEAKASVMPRQARGITARHVDTIASDARDHALATWTRYGRGMAGSAGTIRGRMERGSRPVGYVFADGRGAFFQEHGTTRHPPQPVLGPAAERHAPRWAEDLGDAAARL